MSLRLKIFVVGSLIVTLLVCAIFLFIPKEKSTFVLDEPISQVK